MFTIHTKLYPTHLYPVVRQFTDFNVWMSVKYKFTLFASYKHVNKLCLETAMQGSITSTVSMNVTRLHV